MQVLPILIAVLVASGVGTLTGFGTSTLLVPVMVLFYPVPETLLFVGIIHWFGNVWKLVLFREGFRWGLVLSFGVPGLVATAIGAKLVFDIPSVILSRVLGGMIAAYVLYLFVQSSFRVRPTVVTGAVGGALSGFFAGIFGIGGAVRSLFLTAFDLPKAVYIATAGAIALVIDTTRLSVYASEGVRLPSSLLWGLIVFIPGSFAGAKIAQRLVDRIPQKNFRKVVAVFLLLIAVKLIVWP
ncbi:Sulfite exporter TauE/SafE [Anaerohalosphaera lusitana]|uniref:Probable membrane transporter protein n=1 Tax=Anaerohalosphaera lusitana TaxID=1936003 RepID=A0A1U9NG12_9BACT|nr:sulfite exporter TauE/SafE family protein [Anaerohalosphaera lusitana]AQT66869.1 Sulfite exporter TauE/SafE [Anaerohalosphaera lusitana]